MAPLIQEFSSPRKVLLLFFISFVFTSHLLLLVSAHNTESQEATALVGKSIHGHYQHQPFGRRGILKVASEDDSAIEDDDEEQQQQLQQQQKPIKKKQITTSATATATTSTSLSTKNNKTKLIKPTTTSSTKNQTKLAKPTSSSSDSTKIVKPTSSNSTKNQTKVPKLTTSNSSSSKNKTKLTKPTITDPIEEKTKTPTIKLNSKKLNSTSKPTNSTKSTKPTSLLTKKTSDLPKNNKITTKPITTKPTQSQSKTQVTKQEQKPKQQPKQHSWFDQDDEDDLVAKLAEFRDLPSRFQETLLPDLDIISSTSKVYINKANKEITRGFKPIVGKKYAPIIASIVSCAFILIPLILVSLIFNRIKAYFSLQKLLIFIQIYLSIYFYILCLSALVTGLEPLKFFYATSQSTYVCIQLLQTLAYVLYLLMLLMYMVLVFSTDTPLVSKVLGLGQTFVGFAVGLHYYMTVFHRAVLHQPPQTSWKGHAVYATCFLVICLLARAERRKKAYLADDGGEESKTS